MTLSSAVETAAGAPALLTATGAADPGTWAGEHRTGLRALLTRHGAVMVRGLGLSSVDDAVRFSEAVLDRPVVEREGFAPRDVLDTGVYSSSKWPPDQPMCMHHELSYRREVPGTLIFTCLRAPADSGATAVADAGAVLRDLPADLIARVERDGWVLNRNYNEFVGVPLEQAFGSADRAAVERYASANGIELSWEDDGSLRTTQRAPGVVRHPVTGQRCWFNQLAFLSRWTMAPEVREYLEAEFGADRGLPFTTAHGDGQPLAEDTVAAINDVYDRHAVRLPWHDGDVLLVDNIANAHSREPYRGEREVVVAMGDPVHIHPLLVDP